MSETARKWVFGILFVFSQGLMLWGAYNMGYTTAEMRYEHRERVFKDSHDEIVRMLRKEIKD